MTKQLTYYKLVIESTNPDVDIWVGCDQGHFVITEIGRVVVSLLPGFYTVEFGFGSKKYQVKLFDDLYLHEKNIT